MILHTPNGRKVCYPEEYSVQVEILRECGDLEYILIDVEAWEFLDVSLALFTANIISILSHSAIATILVTIFIFNIGSIIQLYTYSDWLRRIFPLGITAQPMLIIETICSLVYLFIQGSYAGIIVILAFWAATIFGIIDILTVWMLPLRLRTAEPADRVFLLLCNRTLKKRGIGTNNSFYDDIP